MEGMGEAMGAAFGEEVDGEELKRKVEEGFDEMSKEMTGASNGAEVRACPDCGAKLAPDVKRCDGCGKEL